MPSSSKLSLSFRFPHQYPVRISSPPNTCNMTLLSHSP
jgi:hypothetical protein